VPRPPLSFRRELERSSLDDEPLRPSLERPEEPLMPRSELLELLPRDDELPLDALRLELLEPDEALRPSPRSLELEELDEPFDEALRPP
jgi:hypothetical protein